MGALGDRRRRCLASWRRLAFGISGGSLKWPSGVGDSATLVTGSRPSAAQKVAWAVAATPTPIVVPCHRVLGAHGAPTGYRGGLWRKRALLDFEAAHATRPEFRVRHGQLALA
jgi:O-6-methylguanine DNA methyltransferase